MIEIQNLSKSYRTASGQVEALKDVSIRRFYRFAGGAATFGVTAPRMLLLI